MDLSNEMWDPAALPDLQLSGMKHKNHGQRSKTPAAAVASLRQGPALFTTDDVEEEEKEEEANFSFRKVKMFEMIPSDDPEVEERRQRALYAKRNRDMKKREVVKLQRDVAALQAAKEQRQEDLIRMYGITQDQQHKIEELEQCLLDTRQQLRDKEEHVRNSQEKMSLLKAHLEVIAEGLEESNVSRRMLLNLAAQIC